MSCSKNLRTMIYIKTSSCWHHVRRSDVRLTWDRCTWFQYDVVLTGMRCTRMDYDKRKLVCQGVNWISQIILKWVKRSLHSINWMYLVWNVQMNVLRTLIRYTSVQILVIHFGWITAIFMTSEANQSGRGNFYNQSKTLTMWFNQLRTQFDVINQQHFVITTSILTTLSNLGKE